MDIQNEGLKAIAGVAKSLIGAPLEELGGLATDRVKYWRWRNALNIMDRANRIRQSRRKSADPVSLKFFLPFVEECSKEATDDPEDPLNELWVNLLANTNTKSLGFDLICIDVLKQLGSQDAILLNQLSSASSLSEGEVLCKIETERPVTRSIDDFLIATKMSAIQIKSVTGAQSRKYISENIHLIENIHKEVVRSLDKLQIFYHHVKISRPNEEAEISASPQFVNSILSYYSLKNLDLLQERRIELSVEIDGKIVRAIVERNLSILSGESNSPLLIEAPALSDFGRLVVRRITSND